MNRIPKPKYLGPQYGGQFRDRSVAAAYLHRPPYSPELFDTLESLIHSEPRLVLDIGCGTGEIAVPLAERVERGVAGDPYEAMLRMARSRPGWDRANIRWVCESAEDFEYSEQYSLIVAGASLHWMDWYVVLPKMRFSLQENAFLATCGGRQEGSTLPWLHALRKIIPRYSTNREFQPYDLIDELERRSLFEVIGRKRT